MLDTILNIGVFAFLGVIVWLLALPKQVGKDDSDRDGQDQQR